MKNYYAFFLVFFAASFSYSQIVNIPDPAFKAELISQSTSVDTNGDGEIQVSEAEARTNLSLSLCTLDNVIGIQAFTNLQHISFSSYCDIGTPVDLSGMTALKSLHFHKCSIPSVNLAGLIGLESISFGYVGTELLNLPDAVNLKSISMTYGGPYTLDVSGLTNLTDIVSHDGNLQSINLEGTTGLVNLLITSNNSVMEDIDLSDLENLKKLSLSHTHLTSLDLQNNTLLEELTSHHNDFPTIDISMLPNLKRLSCSSSNMASLDVSNNLNLEHLSCYSNQLTTLDVSMLPNLVSLNCHSNNLTMLNVSNNLNLLNLTCSANQLASIDLTSLHGLKNIDVRNNLFTTLDLSGQTAIFAASESVFYEVSDNPNLVSIDLKNGKEDYIDFSGCPSLVYICGDESDISNLNNWINGGNIQVNTYCSFVPGGSYNTITGTISLDDDNNGCDANDAKLVAVKMSLSAANGGGITFTDDLGNYNFYTQSGEFVITPEFENPYFTISPASATINFADGHNNTQTQNFCITPNGVHNDVEVTLIPLEAARPGFDADYRLLYKNKGNQALSGSVALTFNDAVLDFVAASPNADSQSLNQLHWDYTNLAPFESRSIDVTLNVNSPMETPAVNIGYVLNFTAAVTPVEDDETLADNTSVLAQTVVGSFDPNDKTCLEGDTISLEQIGKYLHYMIRFENSGTAAAENIVVKDIIDTTKFDMASLQFTDSSHPLVTRITGNKVEFIFENINLPAGQDDEPGSHGFVTFKIMTNPGLALNDIVENTADIYFDFNFPITTNTASTTVTSLGRGEVENLSVSIAPNPVNDILTISARETITSIQLFDIQGRLLQTKLNNENTATIDFIGKTNGVYFVKAYTEKGIKVLKVIKE